MIYVFKTSVSSRKAIKKLAPAIEQCLPGLKWNFDLKDCDKILRIESSVEIVERTIKLLRANGFECDELPD